MDLRKLIKKKRDKIAISLIIMSFVLYFIMPFNLCLPCSPALKAAVTGTMMVVSEIFFLDRRLDDWPGGSFENQKVFSY